MFGYESIYEFIDTMKYLIPALLIALTLHEFAHAIVAYKLGDDSQKQRGRLTLNPLAHIDPIGCLCLLVFSFGWAKPVEIDPRYFKNPKMGMVLSALAGPIMNFIVAFICMFLYVLLIRLQLEGAYSSSGIMNYFIMLLMYTALLNVGLGVFNLIPIPPLDGSKVLFGFLDEQTYFNIMQYEQYIMIVLLILLSTGVLSGPLGIIRDGIFETFANFWTNILFSF